MPNMVRKPERALFLNGIVAASAPSRELRDAQLRAVFEEAGKAEMNTVGFLKGVAAMVRMMAGTWVGSLLVGPQIQRAVNARK